jgi:hypothetical protein
MPQERLGDVIYLDLTDSTSSFGLNFYEVEPGADATQIAKVASFVMHLFEAIWHVGPETPRLAQVLRNTTRVLIENPGMSFAEIPLLLWDDGVREKLVRRVSNSQSKLFFQQYNRKAPRDREELIASTMNKVDSYLNEPLVSRIVSQSASTINVRRIMDEGKILLVHLSPQLEEPSRLIGALILGRLLMASFSRADTPADKRRPFMIYYDEYHRFATSDFAVFLAEARKSRVATTIAHQTLEQLSDLNRATALQAGTLVALRVSGSDSKELASSLDTTPTQTVVVGQEPVRSPVADVIGHLTRRGHTSDVLTAFTTRYLKPLEADLQRWGHSPYPFLFGCSECRAGDLIEGRRLLNDALYAAQQTGRADGWVHPQALFFLVAQINVHSTYVFFDHLKRAFIETAEFLGLEASANVYGRGDFLENEQAVAHLLRQHDVPTFGDQFFGRPQLNKAAGFLTMLRDLREALAVLAKDPILVDTGQYTDKYQMRTYQDEENRIANELSQLPNYTAKVRLLSGEHRIRTSPAPPLLPEQEVNARIRSIKERMLREGYTIPAAAVEEAVRKRQEALRARPPGNGQQGNGKGRGGPKPPP